MKEMQAAPGLVTRRFALGAPLALTAAGAAVAKPKQRRIDFRSPRDNVRAFVKLTGDVSGASKCIWTRGEIFGLVDGEMARPLARYESARVGRYLPQADGSYRYVYRGLILYQDFESGEFVDAIVNPYTGKQVEVKHYATSIGEYTISPNGIIPSKAFKGESAKVHAGPFILPWTILGDRVWVTSDERVRYQRPSDGEYRVDNAILRYAGHLSELEDESLTSARCESSWQTQLNWFSWLEMGSIKGMVMQGGAGTKLKSAAELPAKFTNFAERKFPGFLTSNR
jgi:hypothetical protein